MKHLLAILTLALTLPAFSQEGRRPLSKRVIVKTNLLSLVARRPTVSIEKVFSSGFSAEASYVQGEFNNFLLTDHYDYNGFLLRGKKHVDDLDFGSLSPYLGVYLGNLKRNIETKGDADNTGWIGYPSRSFSANSIRGGGSIGIAYFAKTRFVVEIMGSLGYGRYINIDKSNPDVYTRGYLDMQVWLSIGYCF